MYIYKTTNLLNGKIYIGLSTRSAKGHNWYKGSGRLILKAIDKYGKKNFSKEILESNISDIEELKSLEKFYIKEYNSRDKDTGYNISPGGIRVPTKEAIEKRANSLRGQPHTEKRKRNISKAKMGTVMSDETKRKMSEAHKGSKHPHRKIQCPHCSKIGGAANMHRYHFDNCKKR